jgi:hypothetical protein
VDCGPLVLTEWPTGNNAPAPMHLAVPLSWSLSLVRPVTLRPNLSVGLPFDSYSAALAALPLPSCDGRDPGVQERSSAKTRPQFLISTARENFSCLATWSSLWGGQG